MSDQPVTADEAQGPQPQPSGYGIRVLILSILGVLSYVYVFVVLPHHEAAMPPVILAGVLAALALLQSRKYGKKLEQGLITAHGCKLIDAGRVIAIIILALFLPMFFFVAEAGCAREKAHQIECLNNVKNISLAILMYSDDHNATFPDADRWVEEIQPYIAAGKAGQLLHCPSDKMKGHVSYAMNSALSGISEDKITEPGNTILIFETSQPGPSPHGGIEAVAKPGNHTGGTNCGFADGHAKWIRSDIIDDLPSKLTAEQFNPRHEMSP
jgi:prepilin-type processing-associated H-X9-DG protein